MWKMLWWWMDDINSMSYWKRVKQSKCTELLIYCALKVKRNQGLFLKLWNYSSNLLLRLTNKNLKWTCDYQMIKILWKLLMENTFLIKIRQFNVIMKIKYILSMDTWFLNITKRKLFLNISARISKIRLQYLYRGYNKLDMS